MRLLIALIGCLAITACTSFVGGIRLESNVDTSPDTIDGLLDGSAPTLNVFLVHGMGDTPECYFDEFLEHAPASVKTAAGNACSYEVQTVYTRHKYSFRSEAIECEDDQSCRIDTFGKLLKKSFTVDDRTINVYAYFWDADAASFENVFTELDKDEGGAWINRQLKDSIIIDGFSDAAFYLGDMGEIVRDGVESALCIMTRDAVSSSFNGSRCDWPDLGSQRAIASQLSNQDFSFISFSLGSRIIFDGISPRAQIDTLEARAPQILSPEELDRLMSRPEEANCSVGGISDIEGKFRGDPVSNEAIDALSRKNILAANVIQIHMAANQLPLLGLGAIQVRQTERETKIRDGVYRLFVDPGATSSALDVSSQNKRIDARNAASNQIENACSSPSLLGYLSCQKNALPRTDFCSVGKRVDSVETVQFVAFRDPNDLLGFRAAEHFSATASNLWEFYEIQHRNAPVYLWSFAWPPAAHAREAVRPQTSDTIWCGATIARSGKIKPNNCR